MCHRRRHGVYARAAAAAGTSSAGATTGGATAAEAEQRLANSTSYLEVTTESWRLQLMGMPQLKA